MSEHESCMADCGCSVLFTVYKGANAYGSPVVVFEDMCLEHTDANPEWVTAMQRAFPSMDVMRFMPHTAGSTKTIVSYGATVPWVERLQ